MSGENWVRTRIRRLDRAVLIICVEIEIRKELTLLTLVLRETVSIGPVPQQLDGQCNTPQTLSENSGPYVVKTSGLLLDNCR
jgi:hypothetical protein